jgi:hypothetical protein
MSKLKDRAEELEVALLDNHADIGFGDETTEYADTLVKMAYSDAESTSAMKKAVGIEIERVIVKLKKQGYIK